MTIPRPTLIAALLCVTASAAEAAAPQSGFAAAMDQAMDRMMERMHVPATGDADRDFVKMMIPHHQGAIDMAVAELRYGKNPQLKRIAQEIIVDQQQEIAAMQLATGGPLPKLEPAPTQQAGQEPVKEH
jgi:uncharacterized protein (DUF305 family)